MSTFSEDMSAVYSEVYDRFTTNNDIIRELGKGTSAVVYASIPKNIAGQIITQYQNGSLTQAQAFDTIRANLQAAKIANVAWKTFARAEIRDLLNLQAGRSHIVRIANADSQDGWITLQLLSGGTIANLESRANVEYGAEPGTSDLPLSFGWHLLAEAADAFLELHFGFVDNVQKPDAVQYAHTDLHGENAMFRYPGAFNDYPDLVVSDLGCAVPYPTRGKENDVLDFYKLQVEDTSSLGNTLDTIMQSYGNADLLTAFQTLIGFKSVIQDVHESNQRRLSMLLEVRALAQLKRGQQYQPLSADLARNPLESTVNNQRLLNFYPALQQAVVMTVAP